MKIKISKLDKLFSDWIRTRDGWICQKCNHWKNPHISSSRMGLHASHYFGRAKWSTRFEPLNVDSLCLACHRFWGSDDREGYRIFKINQLGKDKFNLLQVQATQILPGRNMTYWNGELMDIGLLFEFLKTESKKWNWK